MSSVKRHIGRGHRRIDNRLVRNDSGAVEPFDERDWGNGTSIGVTTPEEGKKAEEKPGASKPRAQKAFNLNDVVRDRRAKQTESDEEILARLKAEIAAKDTVRKEAGN